MCMHWKREDRLARSAGPYSDSKTYSGDFAMSRLIVLVVFLYIPLSLHADITITYQGQLQHDGEPYTGTVDEMTFELFDAETSGDAVAGPVTKSNISVVDGLFQVRLDFGAEAFDGTARFLEIVIHPDPELDGPGIPLTPRQPVTATPVAQFALAGNEGPPGPASPLIDTVPPADHSILVIAENVQPSSKSSTSITTGSDGNPIFSFHDAGNRTLKVAHCQNPDCSEQSISTVSNDAGPYSSLMIGADGLPVISIYNETNGEVQVVHCNSIDCKSSTITAINDSVEPPGPSSLMISAAGFPIIVYVKEGKVHVTHCTSIDCKTATTNELVGPSGTFDARYPAITIRRDGRPAIAFWDHESCKIWFSVCSKTGCDAGERLSTTQVGESCFEPGSSPPWGRTSLIIDEKSSPVIAVDSGDFMEPAMIYCKDPLCAEPSPINSFRPELGYGYSRISTSNPSLAIGADGMLVISQRFEGEVRLNGSIVEEDPGIAFTRCLSADCEKQNALFIGTGEEKDLGYGSSVTIGTDGSPVISYYNSTNETLELVLCANNSCSPFFRRR